MDESRQSSNFFKNEKMKAGKFMGIIMLVLGLILIAVFYWVASAWSAVPKLLIAGPALTVTGFAMLLFPGGEYFITDLQNNTKKGKGIWYAAPTLHKVIWVLAMLIGAGLSLALMLSFGFS